MRDVIVDRAFPDRADRERFLSFVKVIGSVRDGLIAHSDGEAVNMTVRMPDWPPNMEWSSAHSELREINQKQWLADVQTLDDAVNFAWEQLKQKVDPTDH